MSKTSKTRVLILGGGCGGMAAAYTLGATAQRREAFDVTLVSQGWRVGGKGASGRRTDEHDMIEEHGLHIFLGFYRTAFSMLHEAYGKLDGARDGVFESVAHAFTPDRKVTLWAAPGNGGGDGWAEYTLHAPRWPGKPWEGSVDDLRHAPERLASMLYRHSQPVDVDSDLPKAATRQAPDAPHAAAGIMDSFLDRLRELGEDIRLTWHVLGDLLELGGAVLRGYFADILPHGWNAWDRINDVDFRKWLISHGASEKAAWSETVRVIYDLAFAYIGGRGRTEEYADIAAGACLKLVLDLCAGYRDAPMWRMNAGMGDTVFTPLWKCCERQGATFRLFRRVSGIETDRSRITRVRLQVQAETLGNYDPFVRVKSLDCWPSEPKWDQLQGGDALRGINFENPWQHHSLREEVLDVGRDFDEVILAIPPRAAEPITTQLAESNRDWAAMLDKVGRFSVPTHSVQLWFDRDSVAAGWHEAGAISGAYVAPLGTWADMSELLAEETWPAGTAQSCQYLVGVVPMPDFVPPISVEMPDAIERANALGQGMTQDWLDESAGALWPDLMGPDGFNMDAVLGQYDHINIAPTELYVRTPPGSIAYRLPPDWDGFANLSLAGDWTITSINGGSAEAALESGKAAADALCARDGL
ncbi:FAD-dependent oxidoreductase [Pontivivens insulae]|uniref:Amine oxidase domain-containing protein n=1 Tax=Pontivivens insulae TaxID=1639689 RepID=A0A2R8AF79_9RHOB|nr:FAD-dependent oxidoreductase [Pontivivens insulae]RED12143.1 putative NAD(P)-binding protein [Pontivivens insulae]SPF30899.1 hypothetical protein POI8812_03244 [Pontivivens insulae]